jgi:hypothetical protein
MDNQLPRWLALGLVTGLAAALLAGCGGDDPPAGVDGDLTNGWGGLADPAAFVPAAQVCHPDPFTAAVPLAGYQPVDCDQPHLVETVHVGEFGAKAAELDAPPAPDSSPQRRAYRECEEQVKDYLGADFRQGRLWLGVSTPTEQGWQGGARWFRCDLMEIESVYGEPVRREGALSGKLADDQALRLGCYQVAVEDGAVEEMSPVGCDQPHQAEFVGIWRAPDGSYPDPSDDDAEAAVYEGCRERVASYVSVPADGDLVYRTGAIADWMSRQDWQAGDRAFRCYLWLPERELTRSLRDRGTDALPVQTED